MIAKERRPDAMAILKRQRELLKGIEGGILLIGMAERGLAQATPSQLESAIREHLALAAELAGLAGVRYDA